LHNEELHILCPSPNIIRIIKSRRIRWVGLIACMREMRNAYKILVGKPEGKRPLRIPRHRWEDESRMDLTEIRLEGMDWIHLVQDRDWWQALVNTVMSLWVPQKGGNFLTS
jgi:hypothetical protein